MDEISERNMPWYPGVMAYRDFEKRHLDCVRRHNGNHSEEEDKLLLEADRLWMNLTEEELNYFLLNISEECHETQRLQYSSEDRALLEYRKDKSNVEKANS